MVRQATSSSEPVMATKRMVLKKLPPVLVLHLSRFYHDGAGAPYSSTVLHCTVPHRPAPHRTATLARFLLR